MKRRSLESTPIQQLKERFNKNTVYIKREDLLPISFGGNKVRKALLFFEDIEIKNANYIVTYGSSSSNHCRVIANIAASKKIPCLIISPSESSHPTFNSKIIKVLGSDILECPKAQVSYTIDKKMKELSDSGYHPYFIQGGGHGDIGTRAYVDVYNEIVKYEKDSNLFFDYIFLASGTGTTQAGLVCGKLLNEDFSRRIIGISNARKNPNGRKVILDSVASYLKSSGNNMCDKNLIEFIDDYILEGYGSYNESILKTIKSILVNDGIPMDTTYTGKAFWGMKEYLEREEVNDKKVLFIHTGGTPLFFDNVEDLINE